MLVSRGFIVGLATLSILDGCDGGDLSLSILQRSRVPYPFMEFSRVFLIETITLRDIKVTHQSRIPLELREETQMAPTFGMMYHTYILQVSCTI